MSALPVKRTFLIPYCSWFGTPRCGSANTVEFTSIGGERTDEGSVRVEFESFVASDELACTGHQVMAAMRAPCPERQRLPIGRFSQQAHPRRASLLMAVAVRSR